MCGEAIGITDKALQYVMKHLEPGMAEYQAQADFEYMIRYNGAEGTAFPTIAGSGANGTMLHYDTNLDICEDGSLLLMDLGAKYRGYCADITRTYPVNGTYTERQRQVYDIVLAANREVAKTAKPGMTLKELNEIAKKVLCSRLHETRSDRKRGTRLILIICMAYPIILESMCMMSQRLAMKHYNRVPSLLMNQDFTLTNGKSESVSRMIF